MGILYWEGPGLNFGVHKWFRRGRTVQNLRLKRGHLDSRTFVERIQKPEVSDVNRYRRI